MTANGNVEIKDFSFTFPNKKTPFLKNLNLSIDAGEFALIVGPSSSGKSTLALCMAGLYPNVLGGTVQGNILVSGIDSSNSDVSELATKVGIVFQDPDSQFCNLFVEEEVAFGPENLLVEREEVLKRVTRYLKFVNLEGFSLRKIAELSGGQKQRVAIASILSMEPDIIILDQPTANLDPTGKEDIYETLYRLNQETGKTLILIEHQVDELIKYVDKLVVLNQGEIVAHGIPREVLKDKGKWMERECGLWLPEVSRVGLALLDQGIKFERFPISVQELVPQLKTFELNQCNENGEKSKHSDERDVIAVENVCFDYPVKPNILQNVTFKIKKGSIVALMGENGSGKTTLSLMLVGLLKPTSGTILVENLNTLNTPIKDICSKVGYVFQYPEHQFITDSVYEEVTYGLKNKKLGKKVIEEKVQEALNSVELIGLENRHPFTLSMGEKRRLSIATMLVQKPEILILDEPSAGLDYRNCQHMMRILKKLNEDGVTIIMVTHTTYLVARYAEHVLVMDQGKLVFDGDALVLFNNLETIKTKAIEKPEILKVVEYIKESGRRNFPIFLTSDDMIKAFGGGVL